MPLYDGKKLAQEGLLQVAQHCAQAALHAPQLIEKTKIKMEIVAEEELEDFFSVEGAANKHRARLGGGNRRSSKGETNEPGTRVSSEPS